mmetsp:Transcript_19918/g.49709  ORF Transcript_19918/g.49709 Transcript_19918/m.49709 type:complete len:81 (-) Transcript_19918:1231-1473(-)
MCESHPSMDRCMQWRARACSACAHVLSGPYRTDPRNFRARVQLSCEENPTECIASCSISFHFVVCSCLHGARNGDTDGGR